MSAKVGIPTRFTRKVAQQAVAAERGRFVPKAIPEAIVGGCADAASAAAKNAPRNDTFGIYQQYPIGRYPDVICWLYAGQRSQRLAPAEKKQL
jgi:hypothetical protein